MQNFKTVLLFSILNLISSSLFAQIGNNFYFNTASPRVAAHKMTLYGNSSEALPKNVEIQQFSKVKVVDIAGDTVFFTYLPFKDKAQIAIYNKDANGHTKVFAMPKDDFNELTNVYYDRFRGFKYGGYTVPIRLRNTDGNFEFSSGLSLGANIVGRWGSRMKENLFVDASFGVSLSKVDLNSTNSILNTTGTPYENIEVHSLPAFTITLGALFNLAKNVNFGVYIGQDYLSTADNQTEWIYNGKTWLGLGLNVSFIEGATNSDNVK